MNASVLLDACLEAGIDFFCGVPDSYLSGLCDELFRRWGAGGSRHMVAHNEGGAMALCAGHYLATGRPALCYMQNSGLGNAVNPLASLLDEKVYGIPCLLIVGWRGEPGTKDEPQHVTQGAVTLEQLELLHIPFRILSPDLAEADFHRLFTEVLEDLKQGQVTALVARKGALTSPQKPDYRNRFTLLRETAAGIILDAAGPLDVFVSTTGKLSREVFEHRARAGQTHERDFLTVGSMGHASMIALRLALEKPKRRVWCLDGDGALMMHLGAAALIGQQSPPNLIHVVIDNGAHETVGGMPVCSGQLPIHSLAAACGYPTVFCAEEEQQLMECLEQITSGNARGPVLLEVRCACGARADLGRPTIPPKENRDAFMQFVTKS